MLHLAPPKRLADPEVAGAHFDQLVASGLLHENDRLRFLTLVQCRLRERRMRRILHPGSLVVRSLRLGQWLGSEGDEQAAAEWIARSAAEDRTRPPEVAEAVAGVVAAAGLPPDATGPAASVAAPPKAL